MSAGHIPDVQETFRLVTAVLRGTTLSLSLCVYIRTLCIQSLRLLQYIPD